MKKLILPTAVMAAVLASPLAAQTSPHDAKAREIYARVISFRTAAGQAQTPAMVAYLIETLKASGVPGLDIATLDESGEQAMIVRIPGRKAGKPILFSAHMDVVGARREEWERDPFKLIVVVTNPGGHSSRPRADNAIYQLTHALAKIEAYRFPVMANDLTRAYLGAVGRAQSGEVGEALRRFSADPTDAGAAEVLAQTSEFVGTTRMTVRLLGNSKGR